MTWYFFLWSIPAFMLLYHFLTRRYVNPYKLIFIFGKKGSGKSTLLTKYALQYQKKGWPVYTTEDIPGCFKIRHEDIGFTQFPPNSCLILDEVGMVWDNRGFKTFPPQVRDYFKLQRHYRHVVIMASQTFDVDKKIRDLADEMYLVTKKFRVFSWSKRILKKIVLLKSSEGKDGESRLTEDLKFDTLLLFWAGSRHFTFIPRYAKYFSSFAAPQLRQREFEEIPLRLPIKSDNISLVQRLRSLRLKLRGRRPGRGRRHCMK